MHMFSTRSSRAKVLGGAAAAVIAIAAVVALAGGWLPGTVMADDSEAAGPPATAELVRTDLHRVETFRGRLGYGEGRTVEGGPPDATVTWLPEAGEVIRRGEPVLRADDRRIPLLYGGLPLYRSMGPGMKGRDVRLLEENLSALGYDGFTVDSTFSWETSRAVSRWQRDLGVPRTGYIEPHDAVTSPGAIRVGEPQAQVGDGAGTALFTATSTDRTVTIDVDLGSLHLISEGDVVALELPQDVAATGEVTRVGSALEAGDDEELDDVTVPVEIGVNEEDEVLEDVDMAPVDVSMVVESREDVLAAPVEALVALREGGYGLRLPRGDTDVYVAVEVGMFGDGLVEVTGEGIEAGTVVGVPS